MRPLSQVKANLLNLVSDLDYISDAMQEDKDIGPLLKTVADHYQLNLDELKDIDFSDTSSP